MKRGIGFVVTILLVVGAAPPAAAQRGIDSQVFQPAVDAYGLFGLERAETAPAWSIGFQLHFDYTQNPLHLSLQRAENMAARDTSVVDWTATTHLGAFMGLTERLEIAFVAPVTSQRLDPVGFGDPNALSPSAAGFAGAGPSTNIPPPTVAPGDMRWALKWRGWRAGPLAIAGEVVTTLPFGDSTVFLGTRSFTVEPLVMFELDTGTIAFVLNGGYRWHDGKDFVRDPFVNSQAMTSPVVLADADELVAAGGVVWHATDRASLALAALHLEPAAVAASAPRGTHGDAVTDLRGGIVVRATDSVSISIGGAAGAQSAARKEDFSLIVGLAWAPQVERKVEASQVEDRDGDGIPDAQDRCPDEPEDRDGFQDADGCPDPDNDGDGVPDLIDKCPNEPEDRDGFQDADGCPDPDNDGDGIPDDKDLCPNEPETYNGIDDEDGCPDVGEGASTVVQIDERVLFPSGRYQIDTKSSRELDLIALRLRATFRIKLLRIEGHADGREPSPQALSQRRADEVREYLIRHGVSPERLQSAGYGAKRPIETNSTEAGRAINRRVEFIVLESR